jgi:serine/threonine protein phosphatase 1
VHVSLLRAEKWQARMLEEVNFGPWQPAPGEASRPIFAIGDIHGRFDLLVNLVRTIEQVIANESLTHAVVVFLGDYIDRAPRGLRVLRAVFSDDPVKGAEVVRLPGNHEQMMLSFLRAGDPMRPLLIWANNGADRFLSEVGMSLREAAADPTTAKARIKEALGEGLLAAILAMPVHHREAGFLFVHAGIHPRFGLRALSRDWTVMPADNKDGDSDPLWIRGPFLTFQGMHEEGLIVVHGHTPRDEPEFMSNRINLDTEAFLSGRLTCLQIVGSEMRVLQTRGDRQERAGGWL